MTTDVKAPVLPESISKDTLLEQKKEAGKAVVRDEILTDIEADKVVSEVPPP